MLLLLTIFCCPFARIVGKDTFRDNVGDFEYLCHHFQSYNWKGLHTQSITEFIEEDEIRECDLPGLFVYNVYLRQTKYIRLKDEEVIYPKSKGILKGVLHTFPALFLVFRFKPYYSFFVSLLIK